MPCPFSNSIGKPLPPSIKPPAVSVPTLLAEGTSNVCGTVPSLWAHAGLEAALASRTAYAPLVVAHRSGAGEFPENTIAALRYSHMTGACFSQIEVVAAKDGTPMVMQDPNLKRLTGIDKSIHDFLPADVPPLLPKVAWYVNGFEDEEEISTLAYPDDGRRIATLKDYLLEAKKLGMPCFVEPFEGEKEFVRRVAQDIINTQMEKQVVVGHPGDSHIQSALAAMLPETPLLMTAREAVWLGLLFRLGVLQEWPELVPKRRVLNCLKANEFFQRICDFTAVPVSMRWIIWGFGLVCDWLVWRRDFLAFLSKHGIPSVAFILNDSKDWDKAASVGVTAVMTDFPHRCQQHMVYRKMYPTMFS